MNIALYLAAVAAVSAPNGGVQPAGKPHLHYEIVIHGLKEMSPNDRLQEACDLAGYVADDIRNYHYRRKLRTDFEFLRETVCDTPPPK